MMSAYNMTIANLAMAPKGGGMAGLAPLDPPLPPIEYVLGYRFRNKVQP